MYAGKKHPLLKQERGAYKLILKMPLNKRNSGLYYRLL
jgi:hypothetical protein